MAKKREFKIKIKGSDWTIRVLTSKSFEKEHDGNSGAMTIPEKKRIDLISTELHPTYIRHELFHAFVCESNIESTNLTTEQMEELAATIVGEFSIQIIDLCDQIIKYFTFN